MTDAVIMRVDPGRADIDIRKNESLIRNEKVVRQRSRAMRRPRMRALAERCGCGPYTALIVTAAAVVFAQQRALCGKPVRVLLGAVAGDAGAAAARVSDAAPTGKMAHLPEALALTGVAAALAAAREEPAAAAAADPPRLVAVVMTKDNHAATREWVLFHAAQGFDHFYVYDDGSVPPLEQAGTFRGVEHLVTVKAWGAAAPNWKMHVHSHRQLLAYREAAAALLGSNTLLATFDVDEYMWPCDPLVPIAVVVRRAAVERAVLNCPRFGPVAGDYDPAVPAVVQHTRRAPHGPLGEHETVIRRSMPACDTMVPGEGMPCFSSRPKAIYDLRRLSARAAAFLSIHGVEERNGHVNVSSAVVTAITPPGGVPRRHGVCCNHYFAKDMAEIQHKAEKNGNPFYSALAASPGLLAFFNYTEDTVAATRFGPLMRELLAQTA